MINTPVIAFAAIQEKDAIVHSSDLNNISEETAQKIAQDIINEQYDTVYAPDSVASTAVIATLKALKRYWPKIVKVLKKYGVKVAVGKSASSFVDQVLDGVIDVDESIDGVIYGFVDYLAPNANSNVKHIIANAIRLVLPV